MKAAMFAIMLSAAAPATASTDGVLSAERVLDTFTRPVMSWVDFCNGFFQAV